VLLDRGSRDPDRPRWGGCRALRSMTRAQRLIGGRHFSPLALVGEQLQAVQSARAVLGSPLLV
jgi:hypothetical protein